MRNQLIGLLAFYAGLIALIAANVAAFLTHVIVCVHAAAWGFLIAGAIMPLIGIVHGYGIWFGFWH